MKNETKVALKGNSNYARKKRYLAKHPKYHWGWEVPEPKPWRKPKTEGNH